MTTIVPPPPPVPPTAPPPPPPVLTVPNPPPALVQSSLASQLEGLVLADAGKGMVQIQTPLGILDVLSPVALPKDATLTLVLQTLTPKVTLQLAAINGVAQAGLKAAVGSAGTIGATPQGIPTLATPTAPHAAADVQPVTLTAGTVVTTTLLRPAAPIPGLTAPLPAPGAAPATTGQATAGTPSPPGVPAASTPTASSPAPSGPGTPAPPPSSSAPASPPAAPPAAAPAPAPLAAGTRMTVRILSVQPPAATAAAPAPSGPAIPAAGQTLIAVATGTTQGGQTVVRSPAGDMVLPTRTLLPQGTTLTLELTAAPVRPQTTAGTPPSLHQQLLASRSWPVLEETLVALHESNANAAQQVIQTLLPKANTRLSANIMFFLSALRGGDIRGWLGDGPSRILRRFKPEALNRISDDFGRLARAADEPLPGDWRMMLVPFQNGSEIDQIRFFSRRNKDEDEDTDEESGTRFVVDIDLSNLGRLQLDGLVLSAHKKLDLIVRSDDPLPSPMQNDIRRIYEDAGDLTGMKGGLSFQSTPANFVSFEPSQKTDEQVGLIV